MKIQFCQDRNKVLKILILTRVKTEWPKSVFFFFFSYYKMYNTSFPKMHDEEERYNVGIKTAKEVRHSYQLCG